MKKSKFTILKFFILFFILLSLFISMRLLSLKDQNTNPPVIEGIIQQDNDVVTIHSEPSRNTHVVAIANNEDFVEVLNSTENNNTFWYQIKTENETGWILAEYLTIIEGENYHPAK